MKSQKKLIAHIVLMSLLFSFIHVKLFGQSSGNNPYFDENDRHWTNSIRWSNIINALEIEGLVEKGNRVDSLKLYQCMNDISQKGGGVLYFPKGEYFFNYDLQMMDGVVLRGASPSGKIGHPYLLTKFTFPQYIPTFEGNGTPNNTAFKKILGGNVPLKNFGLVNLDINRAVLAFKMLPNTLYHDNVILYGIRQNNAVMIDSKIPSKVQRDEGHAWQRWPLWNGENISLSVENNAVVSSCTINDATTDDFNMPNYMTDDGYIFDDRTIKFRYSLHTVITVIESNNEGNKSINISDNTLNVPKSGLDLYLHPGIVLYAPNIDNEKDKEIIHDFIKVPKSKAQEYVLQDYIQIENNVIKPIVDEQEILLVDRKFHYSALYQGKVKESFQRKVFVENEKDSLVYHLFSPEGEKKQKKYPLVVFFHGIGEVGSDNPLIHFVNTFVDDKSISENPCYVVAPQLYAGNSWISSPDAPPTTSINLTYDLIQKLLKEYPIDKTKIYAAGVSYGGCGVLEILTKKKNIFSAVIMTSYLFDPDAFDLKKMKHTSFQIASGIKDESIPIEYSRLMVQKLKKAGLEVRYNEYDRGHFTWIPLAKDKEFAPWLFSQGR